MVSERATICWAFRSMPFHRGVTRSSEASDTGTVRHTTVAPLNLRSATGAFTWTSQLVREMFARYRPLSPTTCAATEHSQQLSAITYSSVAQNKEKGAYSGPAMILLQFRRCRQMMRHFVSTKHSCVAIPFVLYVALHLSHAAVSLCSHLQHVKVHSPLFACICSICTVLRDCKSTVLRLCHHLYKIRHCILV